MFMDVEVVPGKSVGEFKIGMPISAAISYIQKNYKTISSAELKYCEEDLLGTFVLIDLNEEGLLLRFEPRTQRLHSIEVYDLTRIVLRYCGVAFSGPDTLPTFVLIYGRFGPSFPGEYNRERQTYCLDYPGVTFTFPIPTKWQNFDESELPIEFPDGTTPSASRMVVYHGEKRDTTIPPLDPKDDYFEEVRVYVSHGIKFMKRGCRLNFQSTAQDVLTELGRPDRTFYKHEDKMRIHSGDQAIIGAGCEDYIYNYFKLGLDILFDMRTHVVKKFIFHTNFPCHNDFHVYNKCNFKLFFENDEDVVSSESEVDEKAEGAQVDEEDAARGPQSGDDEEAAASLARKGKRRDSVITAEPKKKAAEAKHEYESEEDGGEEEEEHTVPVHADTNGNGKKKNKSRRNKKKQQSKGKARNDLEDEAEEDDRTLGDLEESDESPRDPRLNRAKNGNNRAEEPKPKDKPKATANTQTKQPPTQARKQDKGKERDAEAREEKNIVVARSTHICPDTKWEEVQQLLPGAPSKPVVNTSTSPFGSTHFYGYKDLIFEVMRNGHLASICMFNMSS